MVKIFVKVGKMGLFGTLWHSLGLFGTLLALFFPQNAVKWDYFPPPKKNKTQKNLSLIKSAIPI